MLPVIDEALRKANLSIRDIDAVAVANTPGLAGSLLVGLGGGAIKEPLPTLDAR